MKALLFPGQGSQIVGMGSEFHNNYKEAKELLINGFLLDVIEKITDREIKNLIKGD